MARSIRNPAKVIAALSAPLVAFFLVQNAVSLATLAMVGRLGDAALAGVGLANALYALLLALLFGLDTGVQAVVSRTTGAGARERMGATLANGLAIAVPLGVVLALTAWIAGPPILGAMLGDPAVAAAGGAFLRTAAPSLLLLSVTIPFNAYWIGSGQPGVAFGVTLFVAPCQVLLNLVLIHGAGAIPGLATAGAGLAVTLASLIGFLAQTLIAARLRPIPGLFKSRPDRAGIGVIARIGWPVSVQQSLLQACLMIAYGIVARIGTAEVAVLNVLSSLMLVPIQAATGLGTAAATLVGQALGRGDSGEAQRWGWRTAGLGALIFLPMALGALAAPRHLLGLFITAPATLELAVWPVRLLALSLSLDAAARILGFSLRGAGATRSATAAPFVTQCLILLPAMWWVGVGLGYGLRGVVTVQVAMTVLEAAAYVWIWRRGRWDGVRIAGLGASPAPHNSAATAYRRVAILGGAGAGKSTLARQFGERLALPVIHLDRLMFDPGWTRVETLVARHRVSAALPPDGWIVEGSYPEVSDLTLPFADLIVWIEQPAWLRVLRAWGKTRLHSDTQRPDRPEGCPEAFGLNYLQAILRFGRWTPALEAAIRSAAPGASIRRLCGDGQVAGFLADPAA